MTAEALVVTLGQVDAAEQAIRAEWERAAQQNDGVARDEAMKVLREAIAFKRALERWVTARSRRVVVA